MNALSALISSIFYIVPVHYISLQHVSRATRAPHRHISAEEKHSLFQECFWQTALWYQDHYPSHDTYPASSYVSETLGRFCHQLNTIYPPLTSLWRNFGSFFLTMLPQFIDVCSNTGNASVLSSPEDKESPSDGRYFSLSFRCLSSSWL